MFRSAVLSIRVKVDEVYRKLHELCDVLEEVTQISHDPNPHELRISESNELLDGLKKLFVESNVNEQIRLMTIAPQTWGRQKIERWFVFIIVFFYLLSFVKSSVTINLLHFLGFELNKVKLEDR